MADKEKKEYSPQEVAEAILKKCQELYNNNSLAKSNTAHEIEAGQEAKNDDAEAPEQLQQGEVTKPDSGDSKYGKKKSEGESEDESEDESEESEESAEEESEESEAEESAEDESEDDESEEKEEKEDKKPFEKSEKLKKGKVFDMATGKKVADEPSPDYEPKKKKKLPKAYAEKQAKMREDKIAAVKGQSKVQAHKDAKGIKSKKDFVRPRGAEMDKCGDMKAMGKSERPLKSFMEKRKKKQ